MFQRRMIVFLALALAAGGCSLKLPTSPQRTMEDAAARVALASAQAAAAAAESPAAGRAGGTDNNGAANAAQSTLTNWNYARQFLYPMVLAKQDLPKSGSMPLLTAPLAGDAVVGFVLDLPDRYVFTTSAELELWQVSQEELVQEAFGNLGRSINLPKPENGIWELRRSDGFNAARLLLKDVWRDLASQVQGKLVIAIPSRDVLLAFSDDNPARVAAMRQQTQRIYSSADNAVTTTWFTYSKEGVLEVYQG